MIRMDSKFKTKIFLKKFYFESSLDWLAIVTKCLDLRRRGVNWDIL